MRKTAPSFYILSVLLFSFLLASNEAGAFPDLIRHGYLNCNNCHVSPAGGGTINDYGRNFSTEGLSTWFVKGEESVLNGAIPRKQIPKWLSIGGDVRALQFWLEDENSQTARSIMMQADLEAAVKVNQWTFDLSFGRFQKGAEEPRPKSRRFFVMYNFNDEVAVRAGRFTPTYGVNFADHYISTRNPLGFDQGNETYNVEASWLSETWSMYLTGVQGPVELNDSLQERAGALQVSYAFHDTYKIGANFWRGKSDTRSRTMTGVHALLGFRPELYYMAEADLQWVTPTGANEQQGLFTYQRLGYEFIPGLHALGTVEYWQFDVGDAASANDRYGVGIDFFPRPHFELQAMWMKMRVKAVSEHFIDYAFALLHYYF